MIKGAEDKVNSSPRFAGSPKPPLKIIKFILSHHFLSDQTKDN